MAPKKPPAKPPEKRSKNGRFGEGNQAAVGKGRPKTLGEFKQLTRGHTVESVNKLVTVMRRGAHPQALRAAELLLDRAWGKPAQRTEISGPEGDAIKVSYDDVREKLIDRAAKLAADAAAADEE